MKHDARDVLECSLLSAASDGARFVAEIEARAGADPFRLSMQRALWGILRKHAATHESFDLTLIAADFLKVHPDGFPWLEDIWRSQWESSHVAYYADQLRAYNNGHEIKVLAEKLRDDTQPDVDEYITALDHLRAQRVDEVTTVTEAIEQAEHRESNPAKAHKTGLQWLDEQLNGGIRDGQLCVVGGRPGAGKSVMMAQIAAAMSKPDCPVLLVSLEMLAAELAQRYLRRSKNREYERQRLERTGLLFVDSTSNLTTITALAKLEKQRHGIRAVVVDYLQLVEVPVQRGQNREQQVATASRAMKRLALDLQVPVIVGSQLGRKTEGKTQPTLSDLRESGSIEQDADLVILLSNDADKPSETIVHLAKHRSGQCGQTTMRLEGARFRFVDDSRDQKTQAAIEAGEAF